MWFQNSFFFGFPNSCHFSPPPSHFYSSLSYFPQFFSWVQTIDLHIRMAMTSTYSIEAQCHQAALRSATTDFLKLMKDKDEHNQEHSARYIFQIKALLDPHVIKLSTRESKELCKQVLETVKDPDCKFLRPNESETESSDEDFLVNFKRPVEEQIFADFPEGTLTPEMWTHIKNAMDFMEQAHTATATALKELKKTISTIPWGPFWLLLQACVQPVIKLCGQHIRQVEHEPSEGRSIMCMLPSPAACKNLAVPMQMVAAALAYLIKTKVSIKTSISNTAKTYFLPEKKLRQGLKGVKYQSGSQRRRWESQGHTQDESSSSESDDNDHDDGAAFAKNNTTQEGKEVNICVTHHQPITTVTLQALYTLHFLTITPYSKFILPGQPFVFSDSLFQI